MRMCSGALLMLAGSPVILTTAMVTLTNCGGGSKARLEEALSWVPADVEWFRFDDWTQINADYDFDKEKYGLIGYKNFPAPIYITKLENNKYSAVLLECTHKGCEVSPVGDILKCPCHGSEYSNTGKVLQSPADKDLYSFSVKTDSENIYVKIKNN